MPARPMPARAALLVAVALTLAGCAETAAPSATPTQSSVGAQAPAPPPPTTVPPSPEPAQPRLASDPAQLVDDLVADELALRDLSSSPAVMQTAARRQQVAYRAIGRHPEWDPIARPRVPPALLEVYDRNVEARRQLASMIRNPQPTVPAWRINPPPPAHELLDHYRQAESTTGVGWNYLAAINLVETAFGRIEGVSTAGAQGPMQFMPSTFAAFGNGGDIHSPRDSIMAAGRYLAANGFVGDPDFALYRYNNSQQYVRAIKDYAAVIASAPEAFTAYHLWDVYYRTTAGDVVLPVGYAADAPIPVEEYLATNPQ